MSQKCLLSCKMGEGKEVAWFTWHVLYTQWIILVLWIGALLLTNSNPSLCL